MGRFKGYLTARVFRKAHGGLKNVLQLLSNVDAETAELIDLEPNTTEEFLTGTSKITYEKYDNDTRKVSEGIERGYDVACKNWFQRCAFIHSSGKFC